MLFERKVAAYIVLEPFAVGNGMHTAAWACDHCDACRFQ